jgi:tRNA(Ile2) C34 agmatinyltransferase TiaS
MNCPRCNKEMEYGSVGKDSGYICRVCKIILPSDYQIETIKCDHCKTFHAETEKCDCRLIKNEN